MDAGGCSLTSPFGTIHETVGRVPVCAATRNSRTGWMLPSWPSWCTVWNSGSGFQISGVPTPLRLGGAEHRVVIAIGLGPGRHVVGPAHAGLVEQVGDVRPLVRRRVVGRLFLLVRLRVQV